MELTSAKFGIFLTSKFLAKIDSANIGNEAFLEPELLIVPERRFPPDIIILSIL